MRMGLEEGRPREFPTDIEQRSGVSRAGPEGFLEECRGGTCGGPLDEWQVASDQASLHLLPR